MTNRPSLPIVDVAALRARSDAAGRARAAAEIGAACRDVGFFYAVGHGMPESLLARLHAASREFFALPLERKLAIEMSRAGRAWRGYFPVGHELTSGRPDRKEGIYFGTEAPPDDPRVRAGAPLEGANLFPAEVPALRSAVLEFLTAATTAARAVLEGIALALDLDADYFHRQYTERPTILFRVFRYPPAPPCGTAADSDWGVGEHTDYGLLTLLAQDEAGGLQVKTPQGWIDAPPIEGALVCNIGDMLDRLTGGVFRSTAHRVRNESGRDRLAFPFFFDPALDARIVPLPMPLSRRAGASVRWDGVDPHAFGGTYGDYLLAKVSKVFPELARDALSADVRSTPASGA